MSVWLKLLLALCVLVGAGGGYLYLFKPQLARQLLSDTPLALPGTSTTAYKWRDAKGNWQLTDQPPAAGIGYETLETRDGDNIVPAFAPKKD